MTVRLHVVLVLALGVSGVPWAAPVLGTPGTSAEYVLTDPAPEAASVVARLKAALGPVEVMGDLPHQWLHLEAEKRNGETVRIWILSRAFPAETLREAAPAIARYIFQRGEVEPREYQHPLTGAPVLPRIGGWRHLFPRAVDVGEDLFPDRVEYLGHVYTRQTLGEGSPAGPPEHVRMVPLRTDMLSGIAHNTRQVDEMRRYDDSDYEYVPLEPSDFEEMIAAGVNVFIAEPETYPWFEEAGVFYWGVGAQHLPYPDLLYDPQYLGPALYFDEPAVVTRDHTIRPRLREDPEFRRAITPQRALADFEAHFAHEVDDVRPWRLHEQLARREDVELGTMRFPQTSIYTWETMVSSGAHQLLYHPEVPDAIVFEPPGQIGARRTLPEMNMSYGCQIPITATEFYYDIIIGFVRGAARASGKEWGISIYGSVDRSEASAFMRRAYDLGATRYFFWVTHRLAAVPHGEMLSLSEQLRVRREEYPHRELERLLHAAEVAILLPPGYNLGHVTMGRGLLWGVPELNLERLNREGVPYRTVMGNFFTEIERCLRHGVGFDLLWDLPDLPLAGYREIVRVREDGQVEVIQGEQRSLRDGPRTPERPEGEAPRIGVALSASRGTVPFTLTATAHVREGSAPLFFSPEPDAAGIHHNLKVLWQLHGPEDEDYHDRPPVVFPGRATPHPDGGHLVEAEIHLAAPGEYRLRAATTDIAGRSAVEWIRLSALE